MRCSIARPEDIETLSELSIRLGNVPFNWGECEASMLVDDGEIIGFAAVQLAWHTAGSWVKEGHRRKGHTYQLRRRLERELRESGVPVYFSIPNTNFEKELFAKYGPVLERLVQIKRLV